MCAQLLERVGSARMRTLWALAAEETTEGGSGLAIEKRLWFRQRFQRQRLVDGTDIRAYVPAFGNDASSECEMD